MDADLLLSCPNVLYWDVQDTDGLMQDCGDFSTSVLHNAINMRFSGQ